MIFIKAVFEPESYDYLDSRKGFFVKREVVLKVVNK